MTILYESALKCSLESQRSDAELPPIFILKAMFTNQQNYNKTQQQTINKKTQNSRNVFLTRIACKCNIRNDYGTCFINSNLISSINNT